MLVCCTDSYAQWKPAGNRIVTEWAAQVDVSNILPEYPRPLMERTEWVNLNGLWQYAILPSGKAMPKTYDGEILVPFAVESALSGVGKNWERTTSYGIGAPFPCLPVGKGNGYC